MNCCNLSSRAGAASFLQRALTSNGHRAGASFKGSFDLVSHSRVPGFSEDCISTLGVVVVHNRKFGKTFKLSSCFPILSRGSSPCQESGRVWSLLSTDSRKQCVRTATSLLGLEEITHAAATGRRSERRGEGRWRGSWRNRSSDTGWRAVVATGGRNTALVAKERKYLCRNQRLAVACAHLNSAAGIGDARATGSSKPGGIQLSPEDADNMSLRHIPSKSLHLATPTWWLESRFHFSFAEYFNSSNVEFGVLRVLNDDLVKPNSGFPPHPHRDMEIFTYILDGYLTHNDSMGSSETLGRGAVQYMSAGSGVRHSEMNKANEMLRFLQIWIKPDRKGLRPNYGSRSFSKEDRHNKLHHVLTSYDRIGMDKDTGTGVIPIHQDANIYVSECDPGVRVQFPVDTRRQAYMVCIEGALSVNDDKVKMEARDAVEVRSHDHGGGAFELNLKADESRGSHFMIIEMARAA